MIKLLSTKILSANNYQVIEKSGIIIDHYNAIDIEKIEFTFNSIIDNAIFTSKNAVEAVLSKKNKNKKTAIA